jgi:hypothetical protein
LGEYSQCGSNKIGTSSTFSFLYAIFFKSQNMGKFAKVSKLQCLKKEKKKVSHNIYSNKLDKKLYVVKVYVIFILKYYCVPLNPS